MLSYQESQLLLFNVNILDLKCNNAASHFSIDQHQRFDYFSDLYNCSCQAVRQDRFYQVHFIRFDCSYWLDQVPSSFLIYCSSSATLRKKLACETHQTFLNFSHRQCQSSSLTNIEKLRRKSPKVLPRTPGCPCIIPALDCLRRAGFK